MRRLLLFAIVLLFIAGVNAQWVTNGPSGTNINCFAFSGADIFAADKGNNGGVYVSADGGSSWTATNSGLPNGTSVFSLAVGSAGIFAGTTGGVYLSTNKGASWTAMNNGLESYYYVTELAINGSTIFASAESDGLFVSTNNGGSWTAANTGLPNDFGAESFLVSGAGVFAASSGGVYLTTNNGGSWSAANNGITGNGLFAYSLANGSAGIFAGTQNGVYLSTDGGGSWASVSTGLPVDYGAYSIVTTGQDIFAGSIYGAMYFSANNAGSWTSQAAGLPGTGILSLAANGSTVFAGTNGNGVYQQSLSGINAGITVIPLQVSAPFKLYPNPTSSNFTIETTGTGSQQLQLFDITGKLLLSQPTQNSKTTIDASGLAAGVYLVSLKSGERVSTEKIVIAK